VKIRFDQDLIDATFLAINPQQETSREELYHISDPQERDAAFADFYAAWFRRIGLESALAGAFAEWPVIETACEEAVFRRVHHAKDEFAELFRAPGLPLRVGIGLRPSTVASGAFADLLRHEFCHLADMLEPEFGYPDDIPRDPSPSGLLARERYRVLWDLSIDARLAKRFDSSTTFPSALERDTRAFAATFTFLPETERDGLLDHLTGGQRPTHECLWAVAGDPRHLTSRASARQPGGTCPVCGFTSFEWADESSEASSAPAIQSEFPDWQPGDGCCFRCAEVYRATRSATIPRTILLPAGMGKGRLPMLADN
jgi:hypothetical protein